MITGSLGHDVAIGIIPSGSTNMIAKELGIPRDPERAALIALGEGSRLFADVARVGDTTCVHMAGAGYDAEIMARANADWKRRYGWPAYLPAALALLRLPSFNAVITIDGTTRTRRARLVICALGSSIISRRFRLGDGIDRTDGLIDVCVWDPPNVLAIVSCFAWIALGRPGRSRWMRQARGRNITLDADRPVRFEVDGESLGTCRQSYACPTSGWQF